MCAVQPEEALDLLRCYLQVGIAPNKWQLVFIVGSLCSFVAALAMGIPLYRLMMQLMSKSFLQDNRGIERSCPSNSACGN